MKLFRDWPHTHTTQFCTEVLCIQNACNINFLYFYLIDNQEDQSTDKFNFRSFTAVCGGIHNNEYGGTLECNKDCDWID